MEIEQAIGDRWGIGASLLNLGNTLAKLDEHFNALQNYKQAKAIYEELKLDHMVEKCNTAIYTCTQTIAVQRRTPPTLDDGYKSKPNYKKRQDRKQLRILLFCVGLAIVFLIAWLKKWQGWIENEELECWDNRSYQPIGHISESPPYQGDARAIETCGAIEHAG